VTLFDSDPAPQRPPAADPTYTWSVPELHDWLDAALTQAVPTSVWIEGEITNLNRSPAGHVYFTLVEPGEDRRSPSHALSVALFKWQKDKVNLQLRRAGGAVKMEDGVRVRVRGDLELYGKRMQVQLKMFAIDPAFTLGDLAARRQQLLARLDTEGLLRANGLLPVPSLPLRVGLVTSAGSAAHADFLHELEVSGLGFEVLCADARVQGVESELTVVAAIRTLERHGVDLIAIVRGGGARIDLAAFDSEPIARAIATSTVAVWCGIGHEIDRSVADEVAHTSWKTPTACASALVEAVRAARDEAERLWTGVLEATAGQLAAHEARHDTRARAIAARSRTALDTAAAALDHRRHRIVRDCAHLLRGAEERVDRAVRRMGPTALRRLDAAGERLDLQAARLRAEDPVRLLERGWSITRSAEGDVVRSASDVAAGDTLLTTLADGVVRSTAEPPEDPTCTTAATAPSPPPRPATPRRSQSSTGSSLSSTHHTSTSTS
jgi:exodeoxyribonuclease VII large subunit